MFALSAVCNEFPRFPSGRTPADVFMVGIAAKPLLFDIIVHAKTLVGLELGIDCVAQCPNRPSLSGVHSSNYFPNPKPEIRSTSIKL